jgi:hypothetical protein
MIERTLGQGELADADLALLQRLVEEEARHPGLWISLRGERASIHALCETLEAEKADLHEFTRDPGGEGFEWMPETRRREQFRADRRKLYPLMADAIAIARRPVHEAGSALAAFPERVVEAKSGLLLAVTRGFTGLALSSQRNQAFLRSLCIALAAERYRLAHGRWPDSLARLRPALLAEVPLDPFDGRPLRYRQRAGGIVVYSVGPRGEDNDGDLDPAESGNIGIQFWAPGDRGHPPLAGPPEPRADARG